MDEYANETAAGAAVLHDDDSDASRFRRALAVLGWSQRWVAAQLGRNERRLRRMAYGRETVNPALLAWIEMLARHMQDDPDDFEQFLAQHPAPEGWTRAAVGQEKN